MAGDDRGMRQSSTFNRMREKYERLASAGDHVVEAASDLLVLLEDLPHDCRSAAVTALERLAQLAPKDQRLLVDALRQTYPPRDA